MHYLGWNGLLSLFFPRIPIILTAWGSDIVFNSKKWIGNGHLIPSGPLREGINSLKKYDAVFLNGNNQNIYEVKETIYKTNPQIEIFETIYRPVNIDKVNLSNKFLIFIL